MCSWEKVKNESITLPTQNHEIAFEFMENFIKAIEKEVIKSVVLYTRTKLNATKSVVNAWDLSILKSHDSRILN